jgi:hypothetical protein
MRSTRAAVLNTTKRQILFSGGKFFATSQAAALLVLLFITPEVVCAADYFVDCAFGNDG